MHTNKKKKKYDIGILSINKDIIIIVSFYWIILHGDIFFLKCSDINKTVYIYNEFWFENINNLFRFSAFFLILLR